MPNEDHEDQLKEPFYPEEEDTAGGLEVESSGSNLLSRQQALKLAGAATLGGTFGLLGYQEAAHARRRRRRAKLAANVPGPHDGTLGATGDSRIAQVFINPFKGKLTKATLVVNKPAGSTQGDWLVQLNVAGNFGSGVNTPTSRVLASTIVPDGLVDEGASTITARFALPAEVLQNVPYALVVSRPGSSDVSVGVRADDPISDRLFLSFTLSGNNFSTVGPENDMVFSTYVLR